MASLADELTNVPLFSGLSQRQLRRLCRDFRARTFKPGTSPVRQGHMSGVGFFVVTEGEASVSVDGREVARLGPGDHFGELGLISERPRTATVTAETTLRCVEIPVWHFRRFVRENPDAAWKLLQYLAGLVADGDRAPRAGASRA